MDPVAVRDASTAQPSFPSPGISRAGERPWTLAPPAPGSFFAGLAGVHRVAAQVLYNRGITSPAAASAFLSSDTSTDTAKWHDPRLLLGMDRAIHRLTQAIQCQEVIGVHGDFDVDGVTAAAILAEGLRAAGATAIPYVPLRTVTGYGLHPLAIDRLASQGARVVVTGDTGTRGLAAAERATQLGVDLIITDHHIPGDELPDVYALVNPLQPGCPYPFKALAGAGVAWKLIRALALAGALPAAAASDLLDLAAIGTIVDVSPLVGENRTIVQAGLRRLADRPRPGLKALLERSGATQYRPMVDERTVAFSLGPRLNAAGRMDDAMVALELLLTRDSATASALVQSLEQKNDQRRLLSDRVFQAARALAEASAHLPVLILRGGDWPVGVIGLVAGRLAEDFHRPVFIIDEQGEMCRGSARAADGYDLVAILDRCADLLVEFGGHARAAGFALPRSSLDALVERLLLVTEGSVASASTPVMADALLDQAEVDWPLHRALQALRPFGEANREPVFLSRGLRLVDARTAGADGKHLRARVRVGGLVLRAFGPNIGHRSRILGRAQLVDVLYSLDWSTWDGRDGLELRLVDLRPAAAGTNA